MNGLSEALQALEGRIAAGERLGRRDTEHLLQTTDLLTLGMLGETARRARSGDRVTFNRVYVVEPGAASFEPASAGEIRIAGRPVSTDDARRRVREVASRRGTATLTAFSLADVLEIVGGDHLALADLARALRGDGLDAVAETPLDELGDTENAIEVVRAALHGGLAAWRVTVTAALPEARLDLIARADEIQRATQAFRAFAPLPRRDPADTPATGYDDVRTIVAARVMTDIAAIQVDWPLYGPKLAQVAIGYGASDIDGIAADDDQSRGPRRAPVPDIERQIRAAAAEPVERDGRFEPRR